MRINGQEIGPTNPVPVSGAGSSASAPSYVQGVNIATVSATIASGGSLSGQVDLGNMKLAAIVMPAAWTAAGLTFSVSTDGMTWSDLYDGSVERNYVVTPGKFVVVPITDWMSVRFLKLRSGTSGAPVVQTVADRVFTLVGQA